MAFPLSAHCILFLHVFSSLVAAGPVPSIPSAVLALSQNPNTTLLHNTTHLSLNARPPEHYYINGAPKPPHLPYSWRITFDSYGDDLASLPNARQCLARAAMVMHHAYESSSMGDHKRRYVDRGVIVEIDPTPRLTWGYWGAAITAIDGMWNEYDAVEMHFSIILALEGIVGKGYIGNVPKVANGFGAAEVGGPRRGRS
ncbi:MAG: hypothetical protein Q9212_004984 [Teloschistes hypoglaucus]